MIRALLAALLLCCSAGAGAQLLEFTDAEARAILRHGPWPAPWSPDSSNRMSGKAEAIELGERLFFDPRLSPSGKVLCATCHAPFRSWQDGRARAFGLADTDRNTPSLLDVRYQRWFGWDGAGDSLWAQSVRPILEPREMGGSVAQAAALVRGDTELSCRFEKVFGKPAPAEDEAVLSGIGKALAAFQETLLSGRAPFDEFRDALERGDRAAAARYLWPPSGGCASSSAAATAAPATSAPFSATANSTIPACRSSSRAGSIRGATAASASCKPIPSTCWAATTTIAAARARSRRGRWPQEHRNFGEFKVPSLRNVARTAPYMHNGSLATLADVVRHYSEINPDRLHSDGEAILKPLRLSADESADLVAFLESLSESASALEPRLPVPPCRR